MESSNAFAENVMPALNPIDHLSTYGYCVLENRIPAALADVMTERFLQLHEDPKNRQYMDNPDDKHYRTLFGMANLDDRVWECATHPDVLTVARHFLGDTCRMVEATSKPNWPGAKAGGLHVDSAHLFKRVPDVPWLINTMWMLTDFTVENGATGIVPMSHLSRTTSPPGDLHSESDIVKPITGSRGSVAMWHGGLYHASRANRSNKVRMGLNIAYYPKWFNHWTENNHQPIWEETYQRMPTAMRRICPGRLGKNRADMYEK